MNFDELEVGKLHLMATEANYTLRCVQAAEDDTLSLASVIGPQTAVRAFAATMQGNGKGRVDFSEISGVYRCEKMSGQGRYLAKMHRLGPGTFQATVMLKDPNFLPCISESTLYDLILSDRFTTPVCREWMPYMMRQLLKYDLLKKHRAFQCSPGMLAAGDADLDTIVSNGLRDGWIEIPEEALV